jgi:hypothetical protein
VRDGHGHGHGHGLAASLAIGGLPRWPACLLAKSERKGGHAHDLDDLSRFSRGAESERRKPIGEVLGIFVIVGSIAPSSFLEHPGIHRSTS